jgi:hypothetical protein
MQERSPGWPAWDHAVHLAGQCVMAYLLRLRVSRLSFDGETGGKIEWQRASAPYESLTDEPFDRALVEADALVALAGGVARWLFRPEAVTAQHIREDDKLADSFLYRTPDDRFVIPHWREYLRQRALTVLNPAENQAVIARLAGRFVDHVKTTASGVYAAVEQETAYIRPRLSVQRSYAREHAAVVGFRETLPFFVSHWGLNQFERRIPELGLASRVDLRLRAARIETVGALLMHSRHSLDRIAGIGSSAIKDIQKRLDVWAFVLAPDSAPRPDPCAPVGFSAAYVYRREVGEAIYEPSHRPHFYRA